jgi:dimethylsulfoniopropionate demethylase
MTAANNPFEAGLGKFCTTDRVTDCIGHAALVEVAKAGPRQQIRSIAIEGAAVPVCDRHWPLRAGGEVVGRVSSAIWSPFQNTNVAIGMVAASHWDPGTELVVETQNGPRPALVRETSWM